MHVARICRETKGGLVDARVVLAVRHVLRLTVMVCTDEDATRGDQDGCAWIVGLASDG